MKKNVFIGGFFNQKLEQQIMSESKGIVHYAANKFQWSMIKGLKYWYNDNLELVTAPFIGAYPNGYKKIFFRAQNTLNNTVNFINLFAVKNIFREKSLKEKVKSLFKKDSIGTIFVYSPHTPFLRTASLLKRNNKDSKICMIVPDLPQYMNLSEKTSFLYRVLKKIDLYFFEKSLKDVDYFVLLTEEMKEALKIINKPYCVIEGIAMLENTSEKNNNIDNELITTLAYDHKYILYTGTLNKKFGVMDLIDSFLRMNDSKISLVLAGSGDSEEKIRSLSNKHDNIYYLGQINNRESLFLQKHALILVNPRSSNEEFTKYSFPSKNIEYLLSGRPVLCYKLQGIPKEYDDYFIYCQSVDDMSKKLKTLVSETSDNLNNIGARGKLFVQKNKNEITQMSKVIHMLEEK